MKKTATGLLLMSGLLLVGCSTNDVEKAQEKVTSLTTQKNEFVNALNAIQEDEVALQEAFDSSLSGDEELSGFADKTAPVFENVENRRESMDEATKAWETLLSDVEELNKLNKEDLPADQVSAVTDLVLNKMDGIVTDYTTVFADNLNDEQAFYEMLGTDEAEMTSFFDGVSAINEASEANQEKLTGLVPLLDEFDQAVSALKGALTTEEE